MQATLLTLYLRGVLVNVPKEVRIPNHHSPENRAPTRQPLSIAREQLPSTHHAAQPLLAVFALQTFGESFAPALEAEAVNFRAVNAAEWVAG